MAMQQDSSDPTGVAVVSGKTQPETVRARRRKANMAFKMALKPGNDWRLIARTCGYPSPRAARVAVEAMMEERLDPSDKEHLRLVVASRLDSLLRGVWRKATNPEDPEHLTAVQRAREIIADHRRVWGIDAPSEVLVTSPTQRDIDELVATVVAGQLPPVENYDIVEAEIVSDEETADAV